MLIGIPKEIKTRETRVGMVPGGVSALTAQGHKVIIESQAGLGAGIKDDDFVKAGAEIVPSAREVWAQSEMIIKVKEPITPEFDLMRPGQIIYTFLHLAAAEELTHALLRRGVTGIAYETIEGPNRSLPLLKPMSEVAGRMAIQVGAQCLEKHHGGKGLLLGGVPGVRRARVAIIGGGIVGINSAKIAIGMGAQVSILDVDAQRLAYLDDVFGSKISTLMSNAENIAKAVEESDLVVGAVLLTGAKAPTLVTDEMIRRMTAGSVLVDVAIDQGGCIEGIRPTTHDEPTYVHHDVLHYAVTNIPGDVPMTSTYALTNVTTPYAIEIASKGLSGALQDNPALLGGINTFDGRLTHRAVAEALNLEYQAF